MQCLKNLKTKKYLARRNKIILYTTVVTDLITISTLLLDSRRAIIF